MVSNSVRVLLTPGLGPPRGLEVQALQERLQATESTNRALRAQLASAPPATGTQADRSRAAPCVHGANREKTETNLGDTADNPRPGPTVQRNLICKMAVEAAKITQAVIHSTCKAVLSLFGLFDSRGDYVHDTGSMATKGVIPRVCRSGLSPRGLSGCRRE